MFSNIYINYIQNIKSDILFKQLNYLNLHKPYIKLKYKTTLLVIHFIQILSLISFVFLIKSKYDSIAIELVIVFYIITYWWIYISASRKVNPRMIFSSPMLYQIWCLSNSVFYTMSLRFLRKRIHLYIRCLTQMIILKVLSVCGLINIWMHI